MSQHQRHIYIDRLARALDACKVCAHELVLVAGIGVESTGHCHPKVVKAIQEQAASLIHTQQNIFAASVPMVRTQLHPTLC